MSHSPPPAKRNRGGGSNHGLPRPPLRSNNTELDTAPLLNISQFGKHVDDEDHANDYALVNHSMSYPPSLRDRMVVDETSRPNMYPNRRQGSLLTILQMQQPSSIQSVANPQPAVSGLVGVHPDRASLMQGNPSVYTPSSQGGPSPTSFHSRLRDRDNEDQLHDDNRNDSDFRSSRMQESSAHGTHDPEVQNAGSLLQRMKLPEANHATPNVPLRDRITRSSEVVKDVHVLPVDDDDGQGDEGPSGSASPFPNTNGTQSGRRRSGGRRKGGRGSRRSRR